MQFAGNQEINLELDRNLKISDNVIRHIILRIRNVDLTPSTMVVSESTNKPDGEGDTVFDNRYIIKLDSI